jgi:uncharacterized protein YsxB (DUF464 family)
MVHRFSADVCNKPSGKEHFIAKQIDKVKRNDVANFEANITVVSSELNDMNRKFNRKIKVNVQINQSIRAGLGKRGL